MTKEQLEKGFRLSNNLESAKSHRAELSDMIEGIEKAKLSKRIFNGKPVEVFFTLNTNHFDFSGKRLATDLMPINVEDFLRVYLLKLDEYIKQLETEFTNL